MRKVWKCRRSEGGAAHYDIGKRVAGCARALSFCVTVTMGDPDFSMDTFCQGLPFLYHQTLGLLVLKGTRGIFYVLAELEEVWLIHPDEYLPTISCMECTPGRSGRVAAEPT